MAEELVTLTIEDHVADVRLNRPDKFNALNAGMFQAIADMIDRLQSEASVRAVVLSGEGEHFCAGADVDSLQEFAAANSAGNKPNDLLPRYGDSSSNLFQYVSCGWRNLRVPVIAALKGVAFGGGCQIALGADMRFAAASAQMSTMEVKWGLIPDMGISQTLCGLVREDIARDLIYTGRVVKAEEALQLGLVTRLVDDPYAEAMAAAKQIAAKNPDAIQAAKQLISDTWRSADEKSGLLLESKLQQEITGSANQQEAVMAQLQKRAPKFIDS